MRIKEGSIRLYYAFDIASEILLEKLEKILGKKPMEMGLEYTKLTPRYIRYAKAPYLVKFGKKTIQLDGKPFEFNVAAKLYDFGVISLHFELPFSGDTSELEQLSDKFSGNAEMEKEAKKYVDRIKKEIADAVVKPVGDSPFEDYIIFYAKEFEKPVSAHELIEKNSLTIARVLRSEGAVELSKEEIDTAVGRSVSYLANDIVIVDWNAAFIYDPGKPYDTFDTLEYANASLLELRVYDTILDNEIDLAYDRIMGLGGITLPFISPFSPTMRRLEEVTFDVIQVTERVENALKLIGDQYLARVYSAALREFHLDDWKASIRKKLDIVKDFYEMLYNRTQTNRTVVLEILIVLLIVFEILITFWPH